MLTSRDRDMRDIQLPTLGHVCFVLAIVCAGLRVFGHPDNFVKATALGVCLVLFGSLCLGYALLLDDIGYLHTWRYFRRKGFGGCAGRIWQSHPVMLTCLLGMVLYADIQ